MQYPTIRASILSACVRSCVNDGGWVGGGASACMCVCANMCARAPMCCWCVSVCVCARVCVAPANIFILGAKICLQDKQKEGEVWWVVGGDGEWV